MKRYVIIFFSFLLILLLGGCRTSRTVSKTVDTEEQRLVTKLLDSPSASELTASLSMNISGRKVSGQLRMRRDRCIQLSASVLGLMEIFRVELFPDRVVVMDRVHNLFSVCHYADIPYRNELGLDFEVVQAILWNRIFSPGSANNVDASTRINYLNSTPDGINSFREVECGYTFLSDGKNLISTLKEGSGFKFRLDYSDFTALLKDFVYPLEQTYSLDTNSSFFKVLVKLSSVSAGIGSWPDQTSISRRMKQVALDELLDNLEI